MKTMLEKITKLKSTALIMLSVIFLSTSNCAMFKKTENIDLENEAQTTEELIDDSQLEKSIEKLLKDTSEQFADSNIHVLVHKGWVLLIGEIPDETMKAQALLIVKEVGGVVEVREYLKVRDNRTLLESAHDNWVKLKVRNKLGIDPEFPSQKIKVHAQLGVVYMMGQINAEHVKQAVLVADAVKGVQEVVTAFEVIQ